MLEVLVGILGSIGLGVLGWTAATLLEASRTLAVHGEKHARHDARLDRLEERCHY